MPRPRKEHITDEMRKKRGIRKVYAKTVLTLDFVNSILTYNPYTGIFIWKERDASHIKFNPRFANKQAGYINTLQKGNRYVIIGINGKQYYAHTLAYFITYGEWADLIDHKDGDGTNNKIYNLVKSTHSNNIMNRKLGKCKSGFIGVSFITKSSKWKATITVNKKPISLGYYNTKDEAINARKQGEIKYGFDKIICAR